MKESRKTLLICLAIPLAAGGLSAWLSSGRMETFQSLNQPPLSPPGWLFPFVWTILYLLMGWASYRLEKEQNSCHNKQGFVLFVYINLDGFEVVNFLCGICFGVFAVKLF